jgi:hypothetical protein
MPNTNVYRGSDATLVLAVDDSSTVEGSLADALISEFDFSNMVGRLTNVQIRLENSVRPYHEIGKRFATELRPGNLNVFGSAERAHINGALLRLLLGDGSQSPPPAQSMPQPVFNMMVNLKNPADPSITTKVIVFGVKFESWSFTLPEDDFVMEGVTFRAMRVSAEEVNA